MNITIQVGTNGETREIRARRFGAFAAHRALHVGEDGESLWAVTHIRTGLGMPVAFDSFPDAAACAILLNKALFLGDFERPTGERWAAFKARAPRVIRGVQRI